MIEILVVGGIVEREVFANRSNLTIDFQSIAPNP